jgi:ATP-dependent exoDNAse (exonuclease V) alpha subunit
MIFDFVIQLDNTAPIFFRQLVHQNTLQEVELAYQLQINSFQGKLAGMLVMQ